MAGEQSGATQLVLIRANRYINYYTSTNPEIKDATRNADATPIDGKAIFGAAVNEEIRISVTTNNNQIYRYKSLAGKRAKIQSCNSLWMI